jgi:hypothetical protein
MAAAAVVGSSHEERGQPCQDYTAVMRSPASCAIVLADGAGSARHAELGARTAVSSMLRMLRTELGTLLALSHSEAAARIVARLQRGLARQAARHDSELHDLASTLLFAATDGERFLCGQLGDGRVARFDPSLHEACALFEPHKGEFLNQTLFLTASSAARELQLVSGSAAEVGGFALLSDGAEESLYQRAQASFAPALLRMVGWLSVHSERRVKEALHKNLTKALRERTGDDVSLAIMRVQAH